MKICHFSDSHGNFTDLEDSDAVVCSGDFFPNISDGVKSLEIDFQKSWLEKNLELFKSWINGKPFLWCGGNHDYFNPCEFLIEKGIQAINLENNLVKFLDLYWYGFPYINYTTGKWNFERHISDMRNEVSLMFDKFEKYHSPDILVCHAPLIGIFDHDGVASHGNSILLNYLLKNIEKLPRYYLHGHVHTPGTKQLEGMFISNAATISRIVEII